jgi:hypothetical protein
VTDRRIAKATAATLIDRRVLAYRGPGPIPAQARHGDQQLPYVAEAAARGLTSVAMRAGTAERSRPQFVRELLKPGRGRVVRDEAGKAAGEGGLSQQIIERHE